VAESPLQNALATTTPRNIGDIFGGFSINWIDALCKNCHRIKVSKNCHRIKVKDFEGHTLASSGNTLESKSLKTRGWTLMFALKTQR